MANSSKRAREEDISIRVAAGEPVPAESFMLRALSSCARALPVDAQEWDVSGLLAEDGQPFSREAVDCWLQCGYSAVCAAALDAAGVSQLSTVAGLTQVLAFADAVGSSDGLYRAACSQLQQLHFVVQLPEQTLELPVAGYVYWFQQTAGAGSKLVQYNLIGTGAVGTPLAPAEQCRDVQQQVAQQLAALLRLAHVLRLQLLLDVLHQFILPNTWPAKGNRRLLSGMVGSVFSGAVLEAALGSSSTLSREAYISSMLSQSCSLTPGKVGHAGLLKPTGAAIFDSDSQLLAFDALLLRDFGGAKAGDAVKVTLDLFGSKSTISQGEVTLKVEGSTSFWTVPAQLLLGHNLPDAAALEAYLAADAAAA